MFAELDRTVWDRLRLTEMACSSLNKGVTTRQTTIVKS